MVAKTSILRLKDTHENRRIRILSNWSHSLFPFYEVDFNFIFIHEGLIVFFVLVGTIIIIRVFARTCYMFEPKI